MSALAKILLGLNMPLFCDGFEEDFRRTSGILSIDRAYSVDNIAAKLKKEDFHILFLFDKIENTGIKNIIEKINHDPSKTNIVLVTMSSDAAYVKECLTCEIRGIISCRADSTSFRNAIITVQSGKFYLCPEMTDLLAGTGFSKESDTNSPELIFGLDEKLIEFFDLKSQGYSYEFISQEMEVALSTVKRYGSQLLNKMRKKGYNNMTDYLSRNGSYRRKLEVITHKS